MISMYPNENAFVEGEDSVPEKVKMKYAQLIMAVKQILTPKIMPSASDAMDLICRFTVNSMSVLGFDYAGIGVGLYTNACRLNHSCWPNCVLTFEGKTAILRTIRDVSMTEEVSC
jgi:SET and MYND domain-containing protein